jgi:hypothetical protein
LPILNRQAGFESPAEEGSRMYAKASMPVLEPRTDRESHLGRGTSMFSMPKSLIEKLAKPGPAPTESGLIDGG